MLQPATAHHWLNHGGKIELAQKGLMRVMNALHVDVDGTAALPMTQKQRIRATQLNINAIMAQRAPTLMSADTWRSIKSSRANDEITTLQCGSIKREARNKS